MDQKKGTEAQHKKSDKNRNWRAALRKTSDWHRNSDCERTAETQIKLGRKITCHIIKWISSKLLIALTKEKLFVAQSKNRNFFGVAATREYCQNSWTVELQELPVIKFD